MEVQEQKISDALFIGLVGSIVVVLISFFLTFYCEIQVLQRLAEQFYPITNWLMTSLDPELGVEDKRVAGVFLAGILTAATLFISLTFLSYIYMTSERTV